MTINLEHITEVIFAKIGGTWDMDVHDGKLTGVGNLGDKEIHELMRRRGLLDTIPKTERIDRERDLAHHLYEEFTKTQPLGTPVEKYFAPWCPEFGRYATGEFYPFFSGDSSHLTQPFNAAITVDLIGRMIDNPNKLILGAQGTDTADAGFLGLIDALTFDTDLPPTLFTGANRSRHEDNSDAPDNFRGLAMMANVSPELYLPDPIYPSGAFWYFHGRLYSLADVVKFDPMEEARFEGQDTFFSLNSYARLSGDVLTLIKLNKERGERVQHDYSHKELIGINWLNYRNTPPLEHITRQLTVDSLYEALCSVYTVNLGSQNPPADDIERILDPSYKAVIVAAHSMGNGSEQIKAALVEAAKQGKIVIVTSRTFIPEVSSRYEESLLSPNTNSQELLLEPYRIISGQNLSPTAARAIAVRSILEGLNQVQTEQLLDKYCEARPPQYGREVQSEPARVVASRTTTGRGGVTVMEGLEPTGYDILGALESALMYIDNTAPFPLRNVSVNTRVTAIHISTQILHEMKPDSDIYHFWNDVKNRIYWCIGSEACRVPGLQDNFPEFKDYAEIIDKLAPHANKLMESLQEYQPFIGALGFYQLVNDLNPGMESMDHGAIDRAFLYSALTSFNDVMKMPSFQDKLRSI